MELQGHEPTEGQFGGCTFTVQHQKKTLPSRFRWESHKKLEARFTLSRFQVFFKQNNLQSEYILLII